MLTRSYLIIIVVVASCFELLAGSQPGASGWHAVLARADTLIRGGRFQDAERLLHPLYEDLRLRGALASSVGLRVRLQQSAILERRQQYAGAVGVLLPLMDDCRAGEAWDMLAEAYLRLALVYEQQQRPARCLAYLRRCHQLVERRALTAPRARLANRTASYERLYGDTTVAVLRAKEAIQLGRRYGQVLEEATGHLLLRPLSGKGPTKHQVHNVSHYE